jgi:hypothetical protein
MGRLAEQGHRNALVLLDRMWQEFEIIEVAEMVAVRAADIARAPPRLRREAALS